jgi:hypothetical protein
MSSLLFSYLALDFFLSQARKMQRTPEARHHLQVQGEPCCCKRKGNFEGCKAVLRIRIPRIHKFLGLPDPDPLVRGMAPDPDPALDPDPLVRGMDPDPDPALDPDPSINMQK